MRVLIYTTVNEKAGLGHWVRSNALAEQAQEMGHEVWLAAEQEPEGYPSVKWNDGVSIGASDDLNNYDWVVVDVPEDHDVNWGQHVDQTRKPFLTCFIDGVGHSNGDHPDLAISQGLEGEYRAPEYLILRPSLLRVRKTRLAWDQVVDQWLVFGGGADPMGLLQGFNRTMWNDQAALVMPRWGGDEPDSRWFQRRSLHWLAGGQGDGVFNLLAVAGKCCLAMGMIVWEALAMGKPCWVFSKTERHLATAMAMDERGWIKAWPETGLPQDQVMEQFLRTEFEPDLPEIDGLGSERIVELMEGYNGK